MCFQRTILLYFVLCHNCIIDQVISQVGPIVSRLSDFDSSDDYRSEGATVSSYYYISVPYFQF